MKPEPCADCGSTTYVVSVIDVDGVRTCAACFVGLTPLLRAGIPILPLNERPAPARKRGAR